MRSLVFWDVLQCGLVVSYNVLGQLVSPIFKGQAVQHCLNMELCLVEILQNHVLNYILICIE